MRKQWEKCRGARAPAVEVQAAFATFSSTVTFAKERDAE
jgi:hypothetical protein